jgi:hypothetical protein
MKKYSPSADLSTWSVDHLKILDDYLTRNRYSYSEDNEFLYTVKGGTPKAGKGGKPVFINGVCISVNRWCHIHFIKTRKAISPIEAKLIYEPISVTIRNKKFVIPKQETAKLYSTFNREMDSLFEHCENESKCIDSYPELVKKIKEANSIYKEDKKAVEFYSGILKARYYTDWVIVNDFRVENGLGIIELHKCNRDEVIYAKFNTSSTEIAIKKIQDLRDAGQPIKMASANPRGVYPKMPDESKLHLHFSESDIKSFSKCQRSK